MSTAGTSWRLLVHDLPKPGEEMYGQAHRVESGELHAQTEAWRLATFDAESAARLDALTASDDRRVLPDTEFDELVVGSWLHVEQQDSDVWWMSVGGVTLHVTARPDGTPSLVSVHMPGSYDDPVEGCGYRLNDENYAARPVEGA